MFPYSSLKAALHLTRALGHRVILTYGPCSICGEVKDHIVFVYPDMTPQEAFEKIWQDVAEYHTDWSVEIGE